MNVDRIREVCLSLPGTTEQIQWGDNLVFKVAGKIFVIATLEAGGRFSFKCPEETFYELTELAGISPAPYLARAHWVLIDPAACRLRPGEVERLLRQSYDLVVAKLPKKTQAALKSSGSKTPGRPSPAIKRARTSTMK
ncbi:MAG TPA: MmcQ/YjbR family DNA-binding protein [Terriglobia bacterium]|nr:MmcQ/YjbR family DNA-binding protein [Terriglobia bacterium]